VGFADLGMEAIYEFTVEDMPVTVAVDSEGNNVHQLAPLVWKEKIARKVFWPDDSRHDQRRGPSMALIVLFILGVGNFAMHRAVAFSGHPGDAHAAVRA
jgi:hypothetical protein